MRRWRRWQDWVTFVAAIWFLIAPWILGGSGPINVNSYLNAAFTGVVLLFMGWGALNFPLTPFGWAKVVVGAWAFVSPWVLGFSAAGAEVWNVRVLGVVFMALGGWVALTWDATRTAGSKKRQPISQETPAIEAISPERGAAAGNTPVELSGRNFVAVTQVTFGGQRPLFYAVRSAEVIATRTPPGQGVVDVTVTTRGGGTSAPHRFTYLAQEAREDAPQPD